MTHYSNTSNPVDFPKLTMIDRLWGEALDRAVPETYMNLTASQIEKVKTVFAELIVKECAEWLKQPVNQTPLSGAVMNIAADRLKEHFGVEK